MSNMGDENNKIQLNDIYELIQNLNKDMKYINKNSKKAIMCIDSIKEDINENTNHNFKLKKELEEKQFNEIKIYKKILLILDQIDNIYIHVKKLENDELMESLEFIKKIITKEMLEINLVEIRAENELFNSEIHKCIGIKEHDEKLHNEIITVIEKGYTLNGKVLRPSSVVICK